MDMQQADEMFSTPMKPEPSVTVRFPQGKRKALIMSYDDGSEHDRRLVAMLNEYRLRATFNLNSERLGAPHHVSKSEVRALYQGHEVAAHGVNHLDLTTLSDKEIDREVADDQKALEDLVGAPVRGLAYPFGSYDERVIGRLSALGLLYGRTTHTTARFGLPARPLALGTSCHHNQALELGARFLEHDGSEMALLCVWGHSFEFDGFLSADRRKDWGYLETFCRLVQGQPDVYYATTFDMLDYLMAARALAGSSVSGRARNEAHRAVWLTHAGRSLVLGPGEVLAFADGSPAE
jgi:hypothetical protein